MYNKPMAPNALKANVAVNLSNTQSHILLIMIQLRPIIIAIKCILHEPPVRMMRAHSIPLLFAIYLMNTGL